MNDARAFRLGMDFLDRSMTYECGGYSCYVACATGDEKIGKEMFNVLRGTVSKR